MENYKSLADEMSALPENTAFRLTPEAHRMILASLRLIDPVERMMSYLGAYGNISPKSELADAVMNALHEVNPK